MKNNNSSGKIFPVIDLGDYILREQTSADAEDFFNYFGDSKVNEYIISFIPKTVEEAKGELNYWINVFKYNDGIYFGIARKDNNKLIGSVGVSGINRTHNRIEASYDLAKEYWGKGIMTKALKEVIKYTFEQLQINRIEAFTMTENIGSIKVLQKCGFTFEGYLRQHRFHRGRYVDVASFSILHSDFTRARHPEPRCHPED